MDGSEKFLNVENVSLHLRDEGHGPPTLLLHGLLDSSCAWDAVIARLKSSSRCLAPDLPGFGQSKAPDNFDCSLPHLAEFVDQLLTAANVREPINLVVHGIGGTFGLAWAVTHQKKINRLAILNTSFFSDHPWFFWSPAWRKPMIGQMALAMLTRARFEKALARQAPTLTPDYIRRTAEMLSPASKNMTMKLLKATEPSAFRGWDVQLRDLTTRVPTIVLWADRDPGSPAPLAERFGARRVVHFPEYGHWLPAEAGDVLAKRLRDFFAPAEPVVRAKSQKPAAK